MYDEGTGLPIVIVQPLQGRWQWLRGFLDALSAECRVITYTLCGDFGADHCVASDGFDLYVRQLEGVIDRAGLERTAICGISFGGAVALRYAARHPGRVSHLVLASAPGPGWRISSEQSRYVSHPLLTLPMFLFGALGRLSAELAAAFPRMWDRVAFVTRTALTALRYPALPHVMARRVRLMETVDLATDASLVTAPTLIVTGSPSLEQVVPVQSTREYLSYIPNSQYEIMEKAGHSGSLMQPLRLARIVGEFINASRT